MWCYGCCCIAPSSKGCAVQCYKHPDLIMSTMALWFTMVHCLALGSRVWFCWCVFIIMSSCHCCHCHCHVIAVSLLSLHHCGVIVVALSPRHVMLSRYCCRCHIVTVLCHVVMVSLLSLHCRSVVSCCHCIVMVLCHVVITSSQCHVMSLLCVVVVVLSPCHRCYRIVAMSLSSSHHHCVIVIVTSSCWHCHHIVVVVIALLFVASLSHHCRIVIVINVIETGWRSQEKERIWASKGHLPPGEHRQTDMSGQGLMFGYETCISCIGSRKQSEWRAHLESTDRWTCQDMESIWVSEGRMEKSLLSLLRCHCHHCHVITVVVVAVVVVTLLLLSHCCCCHVVVVVVVVVTFISPFWCTWGCWTKGECRWAI